MPAKTRGFLAAIRSINKSGLPQLMFTVIEYLELEQTRKLSEERFALFHLLRRHSEMTPMIQDSTLQAVEHSTLAFYEAKTASSSLEDVFCKCLEWLQEFRCGTDLMATNLDKKLIRFKSALRKLQQAHFDVRHFTIVSLSEGLQEWQGLKASILYSRESRQLIIDFESSIASVGNNELLALAREACLLTQPTYGIGYRRQFGRGPVYYAMGISMGDDLHDDEHLRNSQWTTALDLQLMDAGLIRDVYPWNFLTAPHLQREIEDRPLAAWVGAEPRRGQMMPLTDKVTLWRTEDADLAAARGALHNANAIFDDEKHHMAPLELFNVNQNLGSAQDIREFFQAWATKTPEQMRQWFRAKYGVDKFEAGPTRTDKEVLRSILQGLGIKSPEEVEVRDIEEPGVARTLSQQEIVRLLGKDDKRKS